MKVIGYARVSTREQGDSGAGLAAQKRRISQEAERRDWQVEWVSDVSSGKSLKRQGIQAALEILAAGDILVVAKLDRLSRSVADFAELLERARKEGWAVVALDMGVDTTTPAGELVANVMMSVAQWERRVIGQRTSDSSRADRYGRSTTERWRNVARQHRVTDPEGCGLGSWAKAAVLRLPGPARCPAGCRRAG